jgi:putative ABC transport system permease protein
VVATRARMLWRDVWHARGQVLAAAVVVACGVAVLVAMYSTYASLVQARRAYYSEYRFADVFAHLKRAPEGVVGDIARVPGVRRVATRVVQSAVLDVPGLAEPAAARLVSVGAQQTDAALNRLALMRGRWLDPRAQNEVLASETFARANALGPGDRVAAILNGRWESLLIVGTALSPEYVYEVPDGGLFPDNRHFGVLWMSREVLGPAFNMKGAFNDVAVALEQGTVPADAVGQIDRILRPYGGLSAYTRTEQPSNRFLTDELGEIQIMTGAIPALFLAVAAFLMYVILARLAKMQRAEIGLLKAFGYSDRSVGAHYLGFAAATVLVGLLLGFPAGIYVGRLFVELYRRYFHFPRLDWSLPAELATVVFCVIVVVAAIGALAAVRSAITLSPAEAMRPEPPARFRANALDRLGILRRLAPLTRMIVRNVLRRPVKALLSATTIALAIALMIVGRFPVDAVGTLLQWQFERVQRHDVAVVFAEPRPGTALLSSARWPGVRQVQGFRVVPCWLRAGYRSKRVEIMAIDAQETLHRIVDRTGHVVSPSGDGIVLGKKLAEILAVQPGDVVSVEVLEGARPVFPARVARIVDELLGLGAYMAPEALSRELHEADQLSGVYLKADHAQQRELLAALKRIPAVAGVSTRESLLGSIRSTMDRSFGIFSFVLTLFAASIVVGMVYNSMRVALSERGHELASLRVLGFTERETTIVLLGEQALIALAAVPMGLLLGYGAAAALMPEFDREAFRLPLTVSARTMVAASLASLLAALLCGLLVARRLKHLDLIGVLKTRE